MGSLMRMTHGVYWTAISIYRARGRNRRYIFIYCQFTTIGGSNKVIKHEPGSMKAYSPAGHPGTLVSLGCGEA